MITRASISVHPGRVPMTGGSVAGLKCQHRCPRRIRNNNYARLRAARADTRKPPLTAGSWDPLPKRWARQAPA